MNAIIESTLTMSSREIAKLCKKSHFHVKRDIVNFCTELEIDVSKFGCIYKDSQNREQTEYRLDKDLTLTLVSGYKAKIRYAIVKRWRELEEKANPRSTSVERTELRQAVTEAAAKLQMMHWDVYLSVHKHFNVNRIEEIPLAELSLKSQMQEDIIKKL